MKTLKTILLIELIIIIPVIAGIYAWGMIGFQPDNANECTVIGKFYGGYEAADTNGNTDTYYQFKSNDNEVWWALTAKEMGFIPDNNTEYVLIYDNNGTTKVNKTCDCCECEVYDDKLVDIRER